MYFVSETARVELRSGRVQAPAPGPGPRGPITMSCRFVTPNRPAPLNRGCHDRLSSFTQGQMSSIESSFSDWCPPCEARRGRRTFRV